MPTSTKIMIKIMLLSGDLQCAYWHPEVKTSIRGHLLVLGGDDFVQAITDTGTS